MPGSLRRPCGHSGSVRLLQASNRRQLQYPTFTIFCVRCRASEPETVKLSLTLSGIHELWLSAGSNMNVELVEQKKGLKVLEHTCAKLAGWKVGFNLGGFEFVEPSFANAIAASPADEIHGVALKLSLADMASLDSQEGVKPDGSQGQGYAKLSVRVTAYDGREIDAYIYSKQHTKLGTTEVPCSRRYLKILVDGGTAAGLDPDYVARLAALPTYTPSAATLALRATLPPVADLPRMTVAELTATETEGTGGEAPSEFAHVSVLGYVLRIPRGKVFFGSHKGRDITSRQSRQWRGISLDQNDDMGLPPYRLPAGEALLTEPWQSTDAAAYTLPQRASSISSEKTWDAKIRNVC
jgi:hypothetical protein